MRCILLVCLCSSFLISKSQKIINNINTVQRGEFKGNTTINRVDTMFIGQVIINLKNNDSIYFVGTITTYDTASKYYVTVYRFLPKSYDISFNVDIIITFDKPFTPWYMTLPVSPNKIAIGGHRDVYRVNAANGEPNSSNRYSVDFKYLRVRGTITGDDLTIAVKSTKRLYAKIESVYGAIGRK